MMLDALETLLNLDDLTPRVVAALAIAAISLVALTVSAVLLARVLV